MTTGSCSRITRSGGALLLIFLFVAFPRFQGAEGHQGHHSADSAGTTAPAKTGIPDSDWYKVGLDEKPGAIIPGDIAFLDEHGNRVTVGEYVDRPTLVLPIYYSCQQTCAIMLGNLASALPKIPLKPGRDFRVLSLSIDADEGPEIAWPTKNTYTNNRPEWLAGNDWKFLTGDSEAIGRFTGAAGYRFKRTGEHEFVHPNAMIVLGRGGKIIRYLYGPDFLPFDMGMALTEAAKGTPSLTIRKILSYCFAYNPAKKTYTFRLMQFLAGGIFLAMVIGLYFLLRKKRP